MTAGRRDVCAMVLAAGLGTRLRPLTDALPKPLVQVLGVTLLDAALTMLADAGIRRAAVNLHHLADAVGAAACSLGRELQLELTPYREVTLLGTGGGLRNALPSLTGASAVVLLNADTLVDLDLGAMLDVHFRRRAAATLMLRPNPDPQAYAPVLTDDGLAIRQIAGRPEVSGGPHQSWMFGGVHVLRPDVISLLPEGISDINRALHPALIEGGERVQGWLHDGAWWDIGTPRRLLDANLESLARPTPRLARRAATAGFAVSGDRALARDATVAPGARLVRSVLDHGVVVEAGATLVEAVVFAGARIGRGAHVTRSIVGPGETVAPGSSLHDTLRATGKDVPIGWPQAG